MKQDESTLVKQAQEHARTELQEHGTVRPSAYMLVHRNPQTGAPLTHPTAIATQLEGEEGGDGAFAEFVATVRAEADRLQASAVAISGEAEAEIELSGRAETRRVVLIRLETPDGVELMHAAVEEDGARPRLGPFMASGEAEDDISDSMIPATGVTKRVPPRPSD